jgi:hypothetical protein
MSQLGFQLRNGEYEAATTAVLRKYLTPGAVTWARMRDI